MHVPATAWRRARSSRRPQHGPPGGVLTPAVAQAQQRRRRRAMRLAPPYLPQHAAPPPYVALRKWQSAISFGGQPVANCCAALTVGPPAADGDAQQGQCREVERAPNTARLRAVPLSPQVPLHSDDSPPPSIRSMYVCDTRRARRAACTAPLVKPHAGRRRWRPAIRAKLIGMVIASKQKHAEAKAPWGKLHFVL